MCVGGRGATKRPWFLRTILRILAALRRRHGAARGIVERTVAAHHRHRNHIITGMATITTSRTAITTTAAITATAATTSNMCVPLDNNAAAAAAIDDGGGAGWYACCRSWSRYGGVSCILATTTATTYTVCRICAGALTAMRG